jgi:hypothetical protein
MACRPIEGAIAQSARTGHGKVHVEVSSNMECCKRTAERVASFLPQLDVSSGASKVNFAMVRPMGCIYTRGGGITCRKVQSYKLLAYKSTRNK